MQKLSTFMEYTFSMIKPDATERNLVSQIQKMLQNYGLEIVETKTTVLSEEIAKEFYAEHKERSFFGELIKDITAGEVVMQVLKGKDAIKKNREIMGATNPKDAESFTIRNQHGLSIGANSIHGSDSPESAKRELALMFPNFKA